MPPISAAFQYLQLLAFLVLAGLVGNAAAGLAGGLARGLALTAAAVLGAVTQVASLNGLDALHNFTFSFRVVSAITSSHLSKTVNHTFHTNHTLAGQRRHRRRTCVTSVFCDPIGGNVLGIGAWQRLIIADKLDVQTKFLH